MKLPSDDLLRQARRFGSGKECLTGRTPATFTPIPYSTLREWKIRDTGMGREVLIEPRYRNAPDLCLLGLTLRADMERHDFVNVDVFDDARAASMRFRAIREELGADDEAFHDRHKIAFYFKNPSSGIHEYKFTLDNVMSDRWTRFTYR